MHVACFPRSHNLNVYTQTCLTLLDGGPISLCMDRHAIPYKPSRLPGMVGARVPRMTLTRKSTTHATPHHATPHHSTVHAARPHHTAPHHTTPPHTHPHALHHTTLTPTPTPHHTTPHHLTPIYIYMCKVYIYIYILLWVAFRFAPQFWLKEPFFNSQHIHKCTFCVFLQLSV